MSTWGAELEGDFLKKLIGRVDRRLSCRCGVDGTIMFDVVILPP